MKRIRQPATAATLLMAALVASPAPLGAREDVPGYGGLERVIEETTPAERARVPEQTEPLRLDVLAPDARWSMDEAGEPRVKGAHFRVDLDTPAFANFGVRDRRFGDETQGWNGGTCYGMNMLTAQWFRTFVLPFARRSPADRLLDAAGPAVRDELGVPGPVTALNVRDYRLGSYSAQRANRAELYRQAYRLHDDQSYLFNADQELPAQEAYDALERDLGDDDRQVSMISMASLKDNLGHALLIYEVQSGLARSSNGTWLPVRKVLFYDSNSPVEDGANAQQNYLLYFPLAEAFVASPQWKEEATVLAPEVEDGPGGKKIYLADLVYKDIHATPARTWRSVRNSLQAGPDENLEFPDQRGE